MEQNKLYLLAIIPVGIIIIVVIIIAIKKCRTYDKVMKGELPPSALNDGPVEVHHYGPGVNPPYTDPNQPTTIVYQHQPNQPFGQSHRLNIHTPYNHNQNFNVHKPFNHNQNFNVHTPFNHANNMNKNKPLSSHEKFMKDHNARFENMKNSGFDHDMNSHHFM